jgi:hypothetical protein
MTGRPSDYTPEIADAICQRIIEGESLRSISKTEGMPSASTVCRWLGTHADFREQYARAREAQADTLFDEILDIADDSSGDDKWGGENGETRMANSEWISRSKLRVDARKWMAGKLQPKKYGEKVTQEHTGPNGSELPAITVKFVAPDA